MMVAGFGFGLAFLGGLRQLNAVIPPEHRAAVMSAFYVVAYASLSLPAIVAGFVVTHLRPRHDVRDLRQRRRRHCVDCGDRGVAHPAKPTSCRAKPAT